MNKEPTIEDVKAYWDRRPCNIRHSAQDIGSRAFFDEVEARKYRVEPHIPAFANFAAWRGKRVLEIGCGIGTDAINFARAGADYTGIDLSPVSLDLTRKRFEVYGLTATLLSCDGEDLPDDIRHAKFDLVYSFGVIHHTPNPRALIENVRHVLEPDGLLKIMLYAKNSWKAAMIAEGFDQPEAQSGCPLALTYTLEEIQALLSGCFTITESRQAHIFPYQVESYIRHQYVKQPWFETMPPDLFAALERQLGWHFLVTAQPNRSQ